MIQATDERRFRPVCVIFDFWYSNIGNRKLILSSKLHWCTRLKSNRRVNQEDPNNSQISEMMIPPEGYIIHLHQYGFVKIFRIIRSEREADIGQPISLMPLNPTGSPFGILDGISRSTLGVLNNAAVSRNVRAVKKRSSEATSSFPSLIFSVSNLTG